MSKSFVSKLVSKGSVPIYFITCDDLEGRACFYYLISTAQKMQMYEKARAGQFDLNDYGQIIASGYGNTPSAEVKALLKEKYDLDA